VVLASIPTVNAETCDSVNKRASAAIQSKDVAELQAAYDAALDEQCTKNGRQSATLLVRFLASLRLDALRAVPVEAMPISRRLEEAQSIVALDSKIWQANAYFGDLYHQSRQFDAASLQYSLAIDLMTNREATPDGFDVDEFRRVFHKGGLSLLLQDGYIPKPRRNESGMPMGLTCAPTRGAGVKIDYCNIPLQFPTNETTLTPAGRANAEALATALIAASPRPRRIRVVGHTDQHGSDAYNLDLSMRRAQAIARLLRERGVAGPILTEARGEKEPMRLDPSDDMTYRPTDIDRMNRRAEVRFD